MAEQETRVRTWTISAHFADEHGTSTLLHGPEVDRPGVDVVELAPIREAEERLRDMGARDGEIREGACAFCGEGIKDGEPTEDPDWHTMPCIFARVNRAEERVRELEERLSDE